MKALKISAELAQRIADYLATRPFKEVAALISELVKLEALKEKEEK